MSIVNCVSFRYTIPIMKFIPISITIIFAMFGSWLIWKDSRVQTGNMSDDISTATTSGEKIQNISLGVEGDGEFSIINLQKRADQILQRAIVFSSEPPATIKSDIEKQIKENTEVLRGNYDNLIPWISLGQLRKVIGDYEGARDAFEFASLIRPENTISFHNLGDLYGSYLKDFSKAERNYFAAIENDSANVNAYLNLADLYWYEGDKNKIDDLLIAGIKINSKIEDKLPLLARLAKYYAESGDSENAIKYYREIIALDPSNAAVINEEIERLR